ncbi:MAG: carbohydrate kinase family protein [Nitrososphaeria archaeon]
METCIRNERENGELDVIVIGNISIDTNIWPTGKIENTLGGAPTYAGTTFAKLAKKTGAFSYIGKDNYLEAILYFQSAKMDARGLISLRKKTMSFQNIYDASGNRRQACFEVAPKLRIEDMPKQYLSSRAFYISPLAGEVDADMIRKLRASGILMLDPQGLMRTIAADGKVKVSLDSDRLSVALKLVDIVKVGKDEVTAFNMPEERILYMLRDFGAKVSIITRGKAPVKILSDSGIYEINTLDVNVEDPTGAGDVFGAAFLSEYMDSEDPVKAAKFATASAGLKIRFRGTNGFPSKDEVMRHIEHNL